MPDNENNNTPQNENIEQEEINTLTVITKSWDSIIKLNHNQIKIELEKRKLNTEGKITELKSRLFRYLRVVRHRFQ